MLRLKVESVQRDLNSVFAVLVILFRTVHLDIYCSHLVVIISHLKYPSRNQFEGEKVQEMEVEVITGLLSGSGGFDDGVALTYSSFALRPSSTVELEQAFRKPALLPPSGDSTTLASD